MARVEAARQRCYDKEKRNRKHAGFYASRQWKSVQQAVRGLYAGLDIYALYEYGSVKPGRIAHHIRPLEDVWEMRFDTSNIIYVSGSSHIEIHKAYSAGDAQKKQMMKKLRSFQERWKAGEGPAGHGPEPRGR